MSAPRSLRARITLAALVALALGGALGGVLLLAAVERDGRRAVDRELREQAQQVVRGGPGRGFDGPGRGRRAREPARSCSPGAARSSRSRSAGRS